MTSMEDRVAQAWADLEKAQAVTSDVQEKLAKSSATATSRDRAVEVTVGAQGQLSGVRFLENRFQSMAGPQLEASILEASEKARADMASRVMDAFLPLTELSSGYSDIPGAATDWEAIFGQVLGDVTGKNRPTTADDQRLRDEIDEDDERAAD
ncbi:YbaB/EbfC family nucleoid-associated protein [Streptomyces sp. NPDC005576]|uniref:YbaB/EbfC family nucleoid-associated protein n=1 Tax=unclassified Streptomyces TaxID=2593676 RepID=UPI0033E916ED